MSHCPHSPRVSSLSGKWTRSWIMDNSLMRTQAKNWMIERIKQGAKDGHGVFCIGDFQNYLNDTLLPSWEVPKRTLPQRAQAEDGAVSQYLTVSWSTARSWAVALGASFKKHKKGYYVDGHERADVLEHRKEWLSKELQLELRQYLWVQLTVDQATKLKIPGYGAAPSSDEPAPKISKSKRVFVGTSKRSAPKVVLHGTHNTHACVTHWCAFTF